MLMIDSCGFVNKAWPQVNAKYLFVAICTKTTANIEILCYYKFI